MRLTCIISSLGSGGAERVLTRLANAWAAAGADVTILTFDSERTPPFYPLDSKVARRGLDLLSNSTHLVTAIAANARRIAVLRGAIGRTAPDVVVSFMDATNVLSVLATRGLGVPVVVSERINAALYSSGRAWRLLRRVTYPWADRIVVQTQAALRQLPPGLKARAVVIPNPVLAAPDGASTSRPSSRTNRLIAIGRLDDQKGLDLLLRAFQRIAPGHPGWSLQIWGEGPARHGLHELRSELGLDDRVVFAGRTTDVYQIMREADLFVLSSRFEGFPNVLCEAMACGLPVVAFDCPHGPREIIRDGVDGVLVEAESTDRLADALSRLIADEGTRRRLAVRAPDVVHRFGLEKALREWDAVFAGLTGWSRVKGGSLNDA